jgi:hypothetical protein
VGVLEAGVVLQAVAGEPVHADVRQPEQAEGERQRVAAEGSGQRHGGGQRISVPEVVHGRADPSAAQVAEHEQVRQEDHRRDQPPRLVRGREQDQRRREQHEAVKP